MIGLVIIMLLLRLFLIITTTTTTTTIIIFIMRRVARSLCFGCRRSIGQRASRLVMHPTLHRLLPSPHQWGNRLATPGRDTIGQADYAVGLCLSCFCY